MKRALALLFLAGLALLGWGYWNSVAEPEPRTTELWLPDWPVGAPPLRIALISDVHVQGPDMPPERLARLVAKVNEAQPDLVLLAGDYVGDRSLATRYYSDAEIANALGGLRAPLGVWAVLGNHDHWRNGPAMKAALEAVGVHVLTNQAAQVGPLALAGIDDSHSRHADIGATERSAAGLTGPVLVFTHSPDVIPRLPERFNLIFAGHTHCGQIRLPLIGTLASSSRYGDRFGCGLIHEGKRTILVTAGFGTSVVPLRFGAPPDYWLVTLGPPQGPVRR